MRTVCPEGHNSTNDDFCDVCGTRISSSHTRSDTDGKYRASGRFGAGDGQPRETPPSVGAKADAPQSLFPPISEPKPAFSAWSKPEPLPSPHSPLRPPARHEPPWEPAVPPTPSSYSAQAPTETPPLPPVRSEPAPPAHPEPLATQARPEAPQPVASRQDLTGPATTPAHSAPTTTPIPSLTSVTWTLLVASDRVYYDRMREARSLPGPTVEFPAHTSERRIPLAGKQMRIGRRSPGRDLVPEINLADRPVDSGISRLHAVLSLAPDGTWSILDPGSANGTFVNGRELVTGEMVTLHEGDRINLGAWTVITVHRA
jgi:FHA domain